MISWYILWHENNNADIIHNTKKSFCFLITNVYIDKVLFYQKRKKLFLFLYYFTEYEGLINISHSFFILNKMIYKIYLRYIFWFYTCEIKRDLLLILNKSFYWWIYVFNSHKIEMSLLWALTKFFVDKRKYVDILSHMLFAFIQINFKVLNKQKSKLTSIL